MDARVRRFIDEHDLLCPPEGVLVAVSGGLDSVTLFHLLRRLGLDLHVVHVNYHLRGAASDADETLVRELCEANDVPATIVQRPLDEVDQRPRESLQATARRLRYEAFDEVARTHGLTRVAVGHQKDDQVETVLIHVIRGTGLRGLAGMPVRRDISRSSSVQIVRPLLDIRRDDIVAFAEAEGWSWRVDRSNASTRYLRTALRRDVLPPLEQHAGSGGIHNIARMSNLVRSYLEQEWEPRLNEHLARCLEVTDGTVAIDLQPLMDLPVIWQQEIMLTAIRRHASTIPISQDVIEEITGLIDSQVGRRKEYRSHTVWRERGRLVIVPESRDESHAVPRPVWPGDSVGLPGQGALHVNRRERRPDDPVIDEATATIDASTVDLPLTVRRWKEGDRVQPLGMEGHKRISDLLTDVRVAPHRRKEIYVVTSEDRIAWVVGLRIAHFARVRPETSAVIELKLEPSDHAVE